MRDPFSTVCSRSAVVHCKLCSGLSLRIRGLRDWALDHGSHFGRLAMGHAVKACTADTAVQNALVSRVKGLQALQCSVIADRSRVAVTGSVKCHPSSNAALDGQGSNDLRSVMSVKPQV